MSEKFYLIFFITVVTTRFCGNCLEEEKRNNLEHYFIRIAKLLGRHFSEDKNIVYKTSLREGTAQKYFNKPIEFFCNTTNGRSKTPPDSINELRPGDIDIIAVIGDSFSAGNGLISTGMVHTGREYRGLTFAGGGRATWRKYITIPNILKEFNPKLYGYSIDESITTEPDSRLNLAEAMLFSIDMPFSAKAMITRLNSDPNVDMEKHWKLLTIYVGSLDLCVDSCYHKNFKKWIDKHEKDLVKTLRLLRDNIPRLFINLISIPNIFSLHNMQHNSTQCSRVHLLACPCLFKFNITDETTFAFARGLQMWHDRELEIVQRKEFNKKDFTVVIQPFLKNFSFPSNVSGKMKRKVLGHDCIHLSQIGHALSSISLWNNLMEPTANKTMNLLVGDSGRVLCPSEEYPYIITRQNIKGQWKPNINEAAKTIVDKLFPVDN